MATQQTMGLQGNLEAKLKNKHQPILKETICYQETEGMGVVVITLI